MSEQVKNINDRFTVIDNKDIETLSRTHPTIQEEFNRLIKTIHTVNLINKKNNSYLVINKNERCADEVVSIMKKYGL
ncbi:hypothetical protein [Chengkuizengella axinellae]|uniref:Uncharacterized protein n=1 Tax=Chengkuizengella axinellae TaxID=3064388 RepID=A0ABT9J3E4_9BACL|nr:hypothetical protein [Chengkuizengella sp. 2205SS18-9]MDP5276132.1 hypothetical protein [Chengkuizengella sp. 2205SS18-9]